VAFSGERPVARLAARRAPALRDEQGKPCGLVGFFESLPGEPDAAGALFGAAAAFLRERGCGAIVGPMESDTWHRYRLNLGPFAEPPFLMEPHNPDYYEALWQGAGWRPLAEYLSLRVEDPAELLRRLEPRGRLPTGFRLRRLSRLAFGRDLDAIHELSRRSFAQSLLYSEISRAEFRALYRGAAFVVDSDFVWFVERQGEPVAFLFALPDRQRAVAELRRRRGAAALWGFLRHRRARVLNVKTLAVLPEHRRAGLAYALLREVYARAVARGYRACHHCLVRAGNPSERLDLGCGRPLRRYRLYVLENTP
jgi:ribosomal protein S18 acetylase RimI-like enzyme